MTTERVHYYERQYLSAIDFEAEQDYHRDARRRHNLAHHTWGIVVGLELVERTEGGSLAVYILPGMAVDGYGREVVLTAPYKLDSASFDRFNTLAHRQVWIAYDEVEALPPAFGFGVCDVDDTMRRTVESFRIVVDPVGPTHDDVIVDGTPTGLPPSPPVPDKLYLPPDESAPYQELPEDVTQRWLIRLGTVQWDGPNLQFVPAADGRLNEQRRYVGVVAADLYAPTPELRIRSRLAPVEAAALEFAKVEGLGDADLLAPPLGELDVGDLVILAVRHDPCPLAGCLVSKTDVELPPQVPVGALALPGGGEPLPV